MRKSAGAADEKKHRLKDAAEWQAAAKGAHKVGSNCREAHQRDAGGHVLWRNSSMRELSKQDAFGAILELARVPLVLDNRPARRVLDGRPIRHSPRHAKAITLFWETATNFYRKKEKKRQKSREIQCMHAHLGRSRG